VTGLGFAVSRDVVEQDGGSITIEITGEGPTILTIRLPIIS
jgi:signal transduction histidine kinase